MGALSLPVLLNTILFLLVSFIGGYLAVRYKLPAIVGYIIGGIILGFLLKEQFSSDFLSHFAEIGIIFLLFTVGLEMNIAALRRFGRLVIVGGLAQILLSAFFLILLSMAFRFSLVESLIIGFSFSLSSTVVVAKIIQDRGEENSLYGALAIGVLVFQDIVAIPLIIISSSLDGQVEGFALLKNIFLAIFRSGLVLIMMYFIGKRLVPYFFGKVAKRSREILNLFTILFIFSTVYVFSYLGLSAGIAAFIAGVLLSQTLEHYHIFSQIRPIRDIFAILFFVFLGASVNLPMIIVSIPAILLFTFFLITIKIAVTLGIYLFLHLHSRTSFSLAISLAQVGEFAFVILYQGLNLKIIAETNYHFTLVAVLLSIILTPILAQHRNTFYIYIKKWVKKLVPPLYHYVSHTLDREPPHIEALNIKHHVIICGFGRVGRYIGRALSMAEVPFIAIDFNLYTVEKAKEQGINIIYGDPTNIDILDYAQAEAATCIVSAVPERFSQETIILNAKKLNPKIIIFTRVDHEFDQRRMKDLGAEVVIQPEFEAALSIIRKILYDFNISKDDIIGKIKRLKIEHGME
ncbi:hypothetical protein A3J15_03530 [Candidatus Roizmanbacteria bacterium RIFCSPLOWO2_02_FULL_38_10]|uniref:RCK N-terminal domain-containing protein n=1 Tax=Candidatus Roizmanbacteria bacterium RIFCSPLOWO2_02_FULL_38_10 TaxID=1802074 RepID=A0A1F7JKZ4_9BACT|nr:MAG: hypothetical protein A3J15_03530 [Candidatus Roizmanbacteria bacterium RIFCSPLOWO2_02_FULL_38_10]